LIDRASPARAVGACRWRRSGALRHAGVASSPNAEALAGATHPAADGTTELP